MPDDTGSPEVACTAAIDLPDVRCAATEHPHRGAHHRTGELPDGTRWTVFWWTVDQPPHDGEQPASASQAFTEPEPAPPPDRLPPRLRRSDYARMSLAGHQVVPL